MLRQHGLYVHAHCEAKAAQILGEMLEIIMSAQYFLLLPGSEKRIKSTTTQTICS